MNFKELSCSEAKSIINVKDKVLLVFSEDWCPYCTKFLKFIGKHVDYLEKNNISLYFLKKQGRITPRNPEEDYFQQWDIEIIPTVISYKNGKLIHKLENILDIDMICNSLI